MCSKIFQRKRFRGAVVCRGLHPAHGMLEIRDGADL